MFAIVSVVAPVFALMAFGYAAVRLKLFPAEGVKFLVAFVNNFATPCLLFQSMVSVDFRSAFNLAIIGPFYLGALFSLLAGSLIATKLFKNRPGEGVSSGFAATFTNTVLVGLPILSRAYGEEALPVAFSIIGLHGAILLTIGMLTMELVRRDGASLGATLWLAARRIAANPLIWGIAAGLAGNFLGVTLAEPVDAFFTMMASAVVPAALFGIGGALNEYRLADNWLQALAMAALKLVVHPLIAYALMVPLLHVDIAVARYGILLAAMPSGINAYVFATYYNRGVNVATNTVLITTVGSAITVSVWLYLLSL
jgi:malonate transporter and related proteins